ncbi:MAG: hypothetical protein KY439_02695 [Actinobacteria bacterium]|nr:hypothetical protein [Actinomycetota bacterium]
MNRYPWRGALNRVDNFEDPKRVLHALLHGNEIASVAAVFRRATFDDLGGFRSLAYVQDCDSWIRAAAQRSRFKAIPDTLAWHRVHPTQQSGEARRVLALEESLTMLSSARLPAWLWLTARRSRGGLHLQLSRLLRARGQPGVVRHALQGFAGRSLQTSRAVLGASR